VSAGELDHERVPQNWKQRGSVSRMNPLQ
jgi:hypothetical protein